MMNYSMEAWRVCRADSADPTFRAIVERAEALGLRVLGSRGGLPGTAKLIDPATERCLPCARGSRCERGHGPSTVDAVLLDDPNPERAALARDLDDLNAASRAEAQEEEAEARDEMCAVYRAGLARAEREGRLLVVTRAARVSRVAWVEIPERARSGFSTDVLVVEDDDAGDDDAGLFEVACWCAAASRLGLTPSPVPAVLAAAEARMH